MLTALDEQFRAGQISQSDNEHHVEQIETTLAQYGYLEKTQAIPSPFEDGVVRLAFDEFFAGCYSNSQIALLLNERSYRLMHVAELIF